jgi:hypothetical protein
MDGAVEINEELFTHQPLDHQKPSIRLLRREERNPWGPSSSGPQISGEEPLHFMMIQCTIDALPYNCLSYAWGSEGEENKIFVNGKPFYVRRNLFDFLRIYKPGLEIPYIWIDALW